MRSCLASLFLIFYLSLAAQQHTTKWHGNLDINGTKLGLIFEMDMGSNPVATLSVPAQGLKGLKADEMLLKGDSIALSFHSLQMSFRGKLTSEAHITGEFHQRGIKLPLELTQGDAPATAGRIQVPQPPFPYTRKEISFNSPKAGIILKGTYSTPEGDGPFPAVVLISGSGPQDRHAMIAEHPWFTVLSDHLLRAGIAVLQYDERGVGESEGNFTTATTTDLAEDARAALDWLSEQPETNSNKTGVVGHSEGGIIAAMLAAGDQDLPYIILLASPMVDGKELMLQQKLQLELASGLQESAAVASNNLLRKIYDDITESDLKGDELKNYIQQQLRTYTGNALPDEQTELIATQLSSPWMKEFLSTDPSVYNSKIQSKILAIYGSKDLQVDAAINSTKLKETLQATVLNESTIITLDGLNHLLQPAKTGLPHEYNIIRTTIAPEALNLISHWIKTY